jgi:hypothetical protein
MNPISQADSSLTPDVREFVGTLFLPEDLVELRLIETWTESGKHRSEVVERLWVQADSLVASYPTLHQKNQLGANIFYGVNPRSSRGSTKADVAICRTLWADLDDARPDDDQRWRMLPSPSLIVDSGRGVHLYWRLSQPIVMDSQATQFQFESILRGMYRELASDCVQDVSRLLRLPGFINARNFRNGIQPSICKLAEIHPDRVYELAEFQHFAADDRREGQGEEGTSNWPPKGMYYSANRDIRRVRGLVRLLTKNSIDRSKRDYFVVTKLLELGCSQDEVTSMVSNYSKFCGNETYLHRTIENAMRAVRQKH